MADPLFLRAPIGELVGEVDVGRRVAIAALMGVGWTAVRSPTLTTHFIVYDAGAQLQYYLLGTFRHGLHIGAELLYFHYDSPFTHQDPIVGDAIQVGPFAGYKRVLNRGFTLEGQIGYQRRRVWQSTSGEPASSPLLRTGSGLLLNLRFGWSFN
jgi:hypothetical protein